MQIGNPLLEFNTDFNSRGEYLWSHGLISDSTYEALNSACNYSQIRRQYQSGSVSPVCSIVANQLEKEISRFIDSYDITLDVCLSSVQSQSRVLTQMVTVSLKILYLITGSVSFVLYLFSCAARNRTDRCMRRR